MVVHYENKTNKCIWRYSYALLGFWIFTSFFFLTTFIYFVLFEKFLECVSGNECGSRQAVTFRLLGCGYGRHAGSCLEAPGMYLTTQCQILVFGLGKINCSQGAEHLPNNVISGIAVKAQYHKVQCDAL